METRTARFKVRNGRRWEFKDIEIPTDGEITRMADRLHSLRKSHSEKVGKWRVRYFHSRPVTYETIRPYDFFNPPETSYYLNDQTYEPSYFEIYEGNPYRPLWRISISWNDGDTESPYWDRDEMNLVPPPIQDDQPSLFDGNEDVDEQVGTAEPLIEGTPYDVVEVEYERDAEARRICLQHHGSSCSACDFNFGIAYGQIADGFIHVHHLIPISKRGEAYEVDPIADLRPLCPNCHAVAHRRDPPYRIDEIKEMLSDRHRP